MPHTPGPWNVKKHWDDYEITGPNNEEVCRIDNYHFPDPSPEDLSLIAAAPELLEACRIAEKFISDFREATMKNEEPQLFGDYRALKTITSAIAKATGGQ